jgi:hypothetical protein
VLPLADVLRHRTLAVVGRYSHFADKHGAKIVGQMKEAIFRKRVIMIKRKTSGQSLAKFTVTQQVEAFARALDLNALHRLKMLFGESQNAMILFDVRHICRHNRIPIPDWADAQIAKVDAQIFQMLHPTHRKPPERNVTP